MPICPPIFDNMGQFESLCVTLKESMSDLQVVDDVKDRHDLTWSVTEIKMEPGVGVEPTPIGFVYPQNSPPPQKCPPICPLNSRPPSDLDDNLAELISRWDELPDTVKRLLLVMSREGGERK
jgi:hypothetical protein